MKRHFALIATAVTVASVCVAFAAPVPSSTSRSVGGGNAAVTACDAAFTVTYTTSGGKVTTVTVGGIADPTCEGGQLKLTLLGGAATLASGGAVTVPTDGDSVDNSVAVSVSPQPDAWLVDEVAVVVTGP